MSAYPTKLAVLNAALARIGARQVNSLSDGQAEVRVLSALYEGHVADKLTKHAWSWAQKSWPIIPVGQPNNDELWEYRLPADLLSLTQVRVKGCAVDIRRKEGRSIFYPRKEDEMEVVGTYRAPEADWPADFAQAIITGLQARLMVSLLQDFPGGERVTRESERELRQAMVRDMNQIRGQEHNHQPHMLGPHYGVNRFTRRR